jgi:ribose 5-phosphate isomerase B
MSDLFKNMKILLASDHAGFELKKALIEKLKPFYELEDFGTHGPGSVDYPDFADQVAQKIQALNQPPDQDPLKTTPSVVGLLICGSGQGICMRANKYPSVRAALCLAPLHAQLSREHNNANTLCLGARFLSADEAFEITQVFLKTPFAGDRHTARVKKLNSAIK